ncbi:MAG: hypothetical protein IJL32_12230 [Oscillospiraceae bacterium]|nr:hypothetical protein [Oscillospiraceae bacterium]
MNMSDDVTGVTLQIVQKGADVAAHAAKELFDALMRLFAELGRSRDRGNNSNNQTRANANEHTPEVKSTDLTDIKTGRVEMKTLRDNAKAIGDTLSMSENALTKEDMKFIAKKAKAYGIPVAFSNERSKDNIFASVRTADLPLFKQICTELMKSKIAERPQELGNFHCEAWEIPFLTAHLNKNDLSAQFIQTSDGKNLCVFEKKDRKAIELTRDTFVRQCSEVKSNLAFDRDEAGFITIKNLKTGKEISFDEIPDKKTLAENMQKAFGYDDIQSKIAAARFGEEMLTGDQKAKFFSDSAQQEFKQVDANIMVEGEDSVCKEYQCWRVTPKADERPRIVFQNDNGEFAVLEPEKMTRRQMRNVLNEQLGLTDRKVQDALIHKAESIASFHAQSEAHTAEYTFKKSDFDLSDVRNTMGLRKTDEEGNTISSRKLPVSSMNSEITRTEKDFFRVDSTVTAIETDANGVDHELHDKQQLVLSFSDKKSSLQQLREMYEAQGVPAHVAKQMAKEVFKKAEMQNPEKPIQIQEVREKAMTVAYGTQSAEVSTADKQAAASKIAEEFGVPAETAEVIVEKAEEIKQDTARDRVEAAQQTRTNINNAVKQMDERKQEFIFVCSADEPKKTMYIYNGDDGNHSAATYNGANKSGSLPETTDVSKVQEFADQQGIKGDVLVFESQEAYDEYLAADKEVHPENYDVLDLIDGDEEVVPTSEEAAAESVAEAFGNGHEAHPEGNVLNEAAAGFGAAAASDAPLPEMPLPEMPLPDLPPQSMGARR